MKFLIVDDDPAILKVTEKLLTFQGHEVSCVDNALEAMQELNDLSYNILITDATMPAHSGFDLIRSLKKRKELASLTVAMLTGRSDKSDIEQAVSLGVQDYIVKPIDPELFLQKASSLVSKHEQSLPKAPGTIKIEAAMQVPIEVVRITDMGVRIESSYPLNKGDCVNIELKELRGLGLLKKRFKALFSSEKTQSDKVATELVLLNLDEREQRILAQAARRWTQKEAA